MGEKEEETKKMTLVSERSILKFSFAVYSELSLLFKYMRIRFSTLHGCLYIKNQIYLEHEKHKCSAFSVIWQLL